jgi:hypothetical protein
MSKQPLELRQDLGNISLRLVQERLKPTKPQKKSQKNNKKYMKKKKWWRSNKRSPLTKTWGTHVDT